MFGKNYVSDDSKALISGGLIKNVSTNTRNESKLKMNHSGASTSTIVSRSTMHPNLDHLVQSNCEPFNCPICLQRFEIGKGVILRDCLHEFCRKCILHIIHQNKDFIQVNCPYNIEYKCENFLSEREIKGLVTTDEYDAFIENNQRAAIAVANASLIEIDEPALDSAQIEEQPAEPQTSQNSLTINEEFHCPKCFQTFSIENGIVLKDCGHPICKECIIDSFFISQKFQMKCEFQLKSTPSMMCGTRINDYDFRLVLQEVGLMDQPRENVAEEDSVMNSESAEMNVVRNELNFLCGICCLDCPVGGGVRLLTCSHHVCDPCLQETIKQNYDPEIHCPYSKSYLGCKGLLTHCEIENFTSKEEFERFKNIATKKATEPCELYQLMMMDELSYVRNGDEFDCPICFVPCNAGEGIKLRDCLHELCLECFTNTIVHSTDESIKCPFTDENLAHCESLIQEREIRAVVSKDIYEKFLERKLKFAEHSITNTFHCKTVDCPGFGIIEAGDDVMVCVICRHHNCLKCKAIHSNQTCEDYQDSLIGYTKVTERYIKELKTLGDVMNCPKCEALINRMAGCSWLVCTFCKTEICWATKGPRWGPLGQGDISGGCRCKIDGKRCHPDCQNCH